jgi:predicted XRE-type DNA-binding protein
MVHIDNEAIKDILKNKLKYTTQAKLANQLGWSQPKLSRVMNNGIASQQLDTLNEVLALDSVNIEDIVKAD